MNFLRQAQRVHAHTDVYKLPIVCPPTTKQRVIYSNLSGTHVILLYVYTFNILPIPTNYTKYILKIWMDCKLIFVICTSSSV